MRRDVLIKERIGFDDAYWRRAAKVLGISKPEPVPSTAV
jgi:hypothetical protein